MTLDSPARLLERFHEVLVSEIRERRPEYLSDSFTVAEIYQHLVPYASHRDRLGVEMNGDYEDVLLRLLAGRGEYLRLESEPARERLEAELDSPNPDTSLFREYAAAYVHLDRGRVPTGEREADGEPTGGDEVEEMETRPSADESDAVETGVSEDEGISGAGSRDADEPESVADVVESLFDEPTPDVEPGEADVASPVEGHPEPSPDHPAVATVPSDADATPAPDEPPAADAGPGEDDGTCSWCREELPRHEKLRFCPFCGTDVRLVPCPSCGEALQPRWRFCIACGTEVTGA